MKAIVTTLVCLFTMALAQAQNKEQQLQSIKEAYDQAQERVANDGKEGHQRKCLDLVLRDEGGYAGQKIKDVAHIYYYEDHTSAEDGALQVNNKPYFIQHERVYEGYNLYEEYLFKMNDTGEMCDDPLIYAFRRERRDVNDYESEKQYYWANERLIHSKLSIPGEIVEDEDMMNAAKRYYDIFINAFFDLSTRFY